MLLLVSQDFGITLKSSIVLATCKGQHAYFFICNFCEIKFFKKSSKKKRLTELLWPPDLQEAFSKSNYFYFCNFLRYCTDFRERYVQGKALSLLL